MSKVMQADSPRKVNWTPPPLPQTKAVVYTGNKNRFTEQELDCALSWAVILYKREPSIIVKAEIRKIAQRVSDS